MSRRSRLDLDVTDARVALQSQARLVWDTGALDLELLVLDTGSAWQLVGPRADFERIGLPDDGVSARIAVRASTLKAGAAEGCARRRPGFREGILHRDGHGHGHGQGHGQA